MSHHHHMHSLFAFRDSSNDRRTWINKVFIAAHMNAMCHPFRYRILPFQWWIDIIMFVSQAAARHFLETKQFLRTRAIAQSIGFASCVLRKTNNRAHTHTQINWRNLCTNAVGDASVCISLVNRSIWELVRSSRRNESNNNNRKNQQIQVDRWLLLLFSVCVDEWVRVVRCALSHNIIKTKLSPKNWAIKLNYWAMFCVACRHDNT